ncbi:MAG: quinone-dependent dihydroorotate dehydrogenase [Deltaproteobacteria bacterium]|nr:quinone-dependent dihydroorotate dehydrogenase [Deltaproteobacteria bacterium]
MRLYPLLKPLLFRTDPEWAHETITAAAARAASVPGAGPLMRALFGGEHASLRTSLWGLDFPSPLGLAAGFDKNATLLPLMTRLGFGLVEVGTVTPRPQDGNPRPRLFRLPRDQALINRMGFNNLGLEQLAGRLEKFRRNASADGPQVGVNIGKNFDTPLEKATGDYLACLRGVYSLASYIAVNVSSPNTPGLRQLQTRAALEEMVRALVAERTALVSSGAPHVPMLVKLAPDVSGDELEDMARVAVENGLEGLIATNTTIAREGLRDANAGQQGGLSGRPLHHRALETVAALHRLAGDRLVIVGAGGVFDARDAYDFILAGASLVQLYTGLVYRGPGLPGRIKRGLAGFLERDGFASVSQAVGRGG